MTTAESIREGALPQDKLIPSKEMVTNDGYRFFFFDETKTILPHACLENPANGVVVSTSLADPNKRIAAIKAWSGARHSREPGMSWDILHQMLLDSKLDADKKVSDFFYITRHASPADMAPIGVHLEKVPMHLCLAIFNNFSTNSGQEKSTRFQMEFDDAPLQGISSYLRDVNPEALREVEGEYQKFGKLASFFFTTYRDIIGARLRDRFRPTNAKEEKALTARTLDTARVFLLFGQLTGQYVGEGARNWARLIGEMKASPVGFYRDVAGQLQRLLAPTPEEEDALGFKAEAPSLIRHAESADTANRNLASLKNYIAANTNLLREVTINRRFKGEVAQRVTLLPKKYTTAERVVAQYLLSLWPGLDRNGLLAWVNEQSEVTKMEISKIIFAGHSNHREPPSWTGTTDQTIIVDASLAEVRDLDRHRAWTRYIEIPAVFGLPMTKDTFVQILSKGYVLPAYLTEIEEFADLRKSIEDSLNIHYKGLYRLLGLIDRRFKGTADYSLMLNLLPFCHHVPLWMHGNPKQELYMPQQRLKPGGQINYRIAAWDTSQLVANSDPYLEGIRLGARPNPASREEFFDRS